MGITFASESSLIATTDDFGLFWWAFETEHSAPNHSRAKLAPSSSHSIYRSGYRSIALSYRPYSYLFNQLTALIGSTCSLNWLQPSCYVS
jgi:hypothetical protein